MKRFLCVLLVFCFVLGPGFCIPGLAAESSENSDQTEMESLVGLDEIENGTLVYGRNTYWYENERLLKNGEPLELGLDGVERIALSNGLLFAVCDGGETWVLIDGFDENTPEATASASQNEQTIYQFAVDTLCVNTAVACGILSNIQAESSFDPTCSCIDTNGLTSYGICQWNGDRFTGLKSFCNNRGLDYTTLNAQLQFLQYELSGSEKSAFNKVKSVENTAQGAYDAGYKWAQWFERCNSAFYERRAVRARDVYWAKYAYYTGAETQAVSDEDAFWPLGTKGTWNGGLDWPKYVVSGGDHSGTDIQAPLGTPIFASYPGTIVTKDTRRDANGNYAGFGNYIIIKCIVGSKTLYILYAHMSSFADVVVGQHVDAAQLIGYVGSTGNSTGPHLHYQVSEKSGYIYQSQDTLNPANYLPSGPETAHHNVSADKVTSTGMPDPARNINPGDSCYFNICLGGGKKMSNIKLYVTPPEESRILFHAESNVNYGHCYTDNMYTFSKKGTYLYEWAITIDGTEHTYSDRIFVGTDDPIEISVGASTTKATSPVIPDGNATFNQNDVIFLNGCINKGGPLTVELYVTPPGGTESSTPVDSVSNASTWFWLGSGSDGYRLEKSGTYLFRLHAASGGYVKDYTVQITSVSPDTSVHVTSVTLNKSALNLTLASWNGYTSETLAATVMPENATDKSVTWSSSNNGVATVDGNGTVTAIGPGSATITVRTNDGGKTAICTVTVTQKYYLDLNGNRNEENQTQLAGLGTADVYVNGVLQADDVEDYCELWPAGTTYEIADIHAYDGKLFLGSSTEDALSGTINGDTSIRPAFVTSVDIGTGFYAHFRPAGVDKYLTVESDDYNVASHAWAGNLRQVWYFERLADGSYKIKSADNDKCLDVLDFNPSSGASVGVCPDNNDRAQQWYIFQNGDSYQLRAKCTDCVLDYSNADEGANVYMYRNWQGWCQIFEIQQAGILDLNWLLDGQQERFRQSYGTADVYINGSLVADDCTDYVVGWPIGSTYEITDIKPTAGHTHQGVVSGSLTGTLNTGITEVWLSFDTAPVEYTIKYDANGGNGAPATQTKTHGVALTLSSTVPTRTGFTFLGWAESSTATSAQYQPGGSFSKDADTTLYAVWNQQPGEPPVTDEAAIRIAAITGRPGSTVELPITLENNPGISSMKLTLHFDSSVLSVTDIRFGERYANLSGANCMTNETENSVVLNWILTTGQTDLDGLFATVCFTIDPNPEQEDTTVTGEYDPDNVYDENYESVAFRMVNGSVKVIRSIPGDINCDGKINNKDSRLLFQYVSDIAPTQTFDVGAADVNGDGKINNKDARVLFQYVTGIPVILL